jgi:tRNA pseudouridine38-40 synthase
MRTIKLTIAYDGADFHGWQWQPGLPTIQGALNDAARKITQEKVMIHGASRTDTGVHALGQVAHFKTSSDLPALEFQRDPRHGGGRDGTGFSLALAGAR